MFTAHPPCLIVFFPLFPCMQLLFTRKSGKIRVYFYTVRKMYGKKIEKAKSSAALKLVEKANEAGAAGIMDVNFQITGTTVFMYGIAYK